jgi:hypothetical protein
MIRRAFGFWLALALFASGARAQELGGYVTSNAPATVAISNSTGGGVVGWSPTWLRGLVVWLQAGTGVTLSTSPVVAAGTTPPTVTLTGAPVVSVTTLEIDVTTGGARGTAAFTWKLGGVTQQTGQLTAATFLLGSTNVTANFAVGSYTNNNTYTSFATVSTWNDQSQNANHFSNATAATQPKWVPSWTAGGASVKGVAGFLQCAHTANASSMWSGAADGERFLAGQADADPSSGQNGAGGGGSRWGTSGTSEYLGFSDGNIYDQFGTTVRKTISKTAGILASPFIYESYSAASDYQAFVNGASVFTTATNTVGFGTSQPTLFLDNGGDQGTNQIGEVVAFNRKLTAIERVMVSEFLGRKFAIVVP